jgi:tetratricopeptide (TPR) repeat protein
MGAGLRPRATADIITTEDLHWVDPSSLELIQLLVEQGATARLLLLYTARPEFHAPWPQRPHHTQITLSRLSARNVRAMVADVAANKTMSDESIATVVERTGGVPLFVEELTRAVLESGDAKLIGREIPATLHDSLMARLDRLGPAKEIIQIGAVIGSEFSYELLHAVHATGEAELQAALRALTDAELLYIRGIAPDATYQFKHALIRDAAYEALLKSRRKELHLTVARTIDKNFPTLKEAHPEVLARHWTDAGKAELAIGEWSRAGKAAESRNAFAEALESYQRAVSLIALVPESPERDLRELKLRQSIVSMLQMTRGQAAPEAVEAAERSGALTEKSGNLAQLIDLTISRGFAAYSASDLPTAGMLADRALELAVREGSPTSLGRVHNLQMQTRASRGDLAGVEKHFTIGLKFFDDPGFRRFPGAALAAFAHASRNAWLCGRADVARERDVQMTAIANANHPYEMAVSAYWAAWLRVLMREYQQAENLAAQALELSEENQFRQVATLSRCILGHARAQLGDANAGIGLIRQGLAGLLEAGTPLGISELTGYLVAAQARAGATVDALETVEQALQANPYVLVNRPETLRMRGELRFKQGRTQLAEADFRAAIELAQEMSAKAWELRTMMSLTRLLDNTGRRGEARMMLADIYNWFTEGFDTADLKDAKALLDQLSA